MAHSRMIPLLLLVLCLCPLGCASVGAYQPELGVEPRVIATDPQTYSNNVSADRETISVTFDQPMRIQSWWWGERRGSEVATPEHESNCSYNSDRTTCTLDVKLEPGTVYWLQLNSDIHRYFLTEGHIRAKQHALLFATRTADGEPTPIPEALLAEAKRVNAAPTLHPELEKVNTELVVPKALVDAPHTTQTRWPPKGEPIRIPITRDTWLSKTGEERYSSNGGAQRLKLKGQQEYILFDADLAKLKGRIITGAMWHFRCQDPRTKPMMRVTVSTLASPWVEGTSTDYQRQMGSSSYTQAELGKRDWAYPGDTPAGTIVEDMTDRSARSRQSKSTLMDVAFGRGHTLWRFADASPPDDNGWQALAVSPDVVAARIAGLSHGFAACDDVGNEWSFVDGQFEYRHYPNRFMFSRESGESAHYLEVWTRGTDSRPPDPITDVTMTTDDLPPGQALLEWATPDDSGGGKVLGFQAEYTDERGQKHEFPRYLIPMASDSGEPVRMHIKDLPLKPGQEIEISLAAVDSAGNVGEAVRKRIRVSDEPAALKIPPTTLKPFSPSRTLPQVGGVKIAVVDLVDKINAENGRIIPHHEPGYLGGNHLWSAEKNIIRLLSARNEAVCFNLNLQGRAENISARLRFDDAGLKARVYRYDYTNSANGPVPDACIELDGTTSLPPANDPEAANATNISLLCEVYVSHEVAAGDTTGVLYISCDGEELKIPVRLHVWDFTLPNKLSFIPEMNAYATATPHGKGLQYYRVAHEHRTCINRLYYSWDGVPDLRPWWNGSGFEWSRWDESFGPLLDGSAFAGLPRDGEPVDVFYLPISENWPVNVFQPFRPSYWAEDAFTPAYRDGFRMACAELARHMNEKGYHDTIFHAYLNNKVYYKGRVGWYGSSAPWIFDEPNNTQDFWALRWYGILFHQGVDPVRGNAKMFYRGDISYSQHERNMFWGVMDWECFGGGNDQKARQKADEQTLWGRSYFTQYGSANDPKDANSQPVVWCLQVWSRGGIGVLPWLTIAYGDALSNSSKTDLFYEYNDRIVPSVRVKAFRRGQQDVEYLTLLGAEYDVPQFAVSAGMGAMVDLDATIRKESETDAGTIEFDKARPEDLWRLRVSTGAMISAKHPPYRRVIREFPTPRTDMSRLPDMGYVPVAPTVPAARPVMTPPAPDQE